MLNMGTEILIGLFGFENLFYFNQNGMFPREKDITNHLRQLRKDISFPRSTEKPVMMFVASAVLIVANQYVWWLCQLIVT